MENKNIKCEALVNSLSTFKACGSVPTYVPYFRNMPDINVCSTYT